MNYKVEYAKFNNYFLKTLESIYKSAVQGNENAQYLVDSIVNNNIDIEKIVYKKFIDSSESVKINDKKYTMLPLGLLNQRILPQYIEEGRTARLSINSFRNALVYEPEFVSLHYPNSRQYTKEALSKICASYIKHYKDTLGEEWTESDFYKMFFKLEYLTVKYAVNEEKGEIFAVGFFGATVRNGAGGKCLTNAELYVMPEFRKKGIAKKLVALSFEQSLQDNIENFDSITYRTPGNDSLGFWTSIGASISGLTHIEGGVSDIKDTISKQLSGHINNK